MVVQEAATNIKTVWFAWGSALHLTVCIAYVMNVRTAESDPARASFVGARREVNRIA